MQIKAGQDISLDSGKKLGDPASTINPSYKKKKDPPKKLDESQRIKSHNILHQANLQWGS